MKKRIAELMNGEPNGKHNNQRPTSARGFFNETNQQDRVHRRLIIIQEILQFYSLAFMREGMKVEGGECAHYD